MKLQQRQRPLLRLGAVVLFAGAGMILFGFFGANWSTDATGQQVTQRVLDAYIVEATQVDAMLPGPARDAARAALDSGAFYRALFPNVGIPLWAALYMLLGANLLRLGVIDPHYRGAVAPPGPRRVLAALRLIFALLFYVVLPGLMLRAGGLIIDGNAALGFWLEVTGFGLVAVVLCGYYVRRFSDAVTSAD